MTTAVLAIPGPAWANAHTWVHDRLQAAFADWLILPEEDNVRLDALPAVVWSLTLANPDPRGIWTGNLTLSLMCTTERAATAVPALHSVVQGWETPGPIHSVSLISHRKLPRTAGADRNTHQYQFTYALMWA